MMASTFDTEEFIREVEDRPPLWDTSLEQYTNAEVRKILWEEIADIFRPFSSTKEKEELCSSLQKKWKNIRDCFTRELRRLKSEKKRLPAKRKNPYIYFDQLRFLISTVPASESILSDVEPQPFGLRCQSGDDDEPPPKKKKEEDPIDQQLLEMLDQSLRKKEQSEHLEADEDRLFLLSLLQDLKRVPENLKMRTKIELMVVLDKAKKGASSFSHTDN